MLGALVMLALPTTYYWQDPWHDPAHDPSTLWGTLAHLLPPLCKILPTLILFTLGLRAAWRKNHCAKDCKEAT